MNPLRKIGRFYIDGFKEMTIGKTLWLIILCKLFVMFFILKPIFFPNRLKDLPDEAAKSAVVADDLVKRNTAAEANATPVSPRPFHSGTASGRR